MRPGKRILCVEDHEDTRFMLDLLLRRENYDVVLADTVITALLLAQSRSFDLYILDKRFRSGTGTELCRQIRDFDTKTPIVFYSGAAGDSDRAEAQSAGAQAYIAKPYIEELLTAVRQLLPPDKNPLDSEESIKVMSCRDKKAESL